MSSKMSITKRNIYVPEGTEWERSNNTRSDANKQASPIGTKMMPIKANIDTTCKWVRKSSNTKLKYKQSKNTKILIHRIGASGLQLKVLILVCKQEALVV